MNKYSQISKNVHILQENSKKIETVLLAITQKFNIKIPEILKELDKIKIDANYTQQQLNKIQNFLHTFAKELNVELRNPLLRLQKHNYKLILFMKNRISPLTKTNTDKAHEIKEIIQPIAVLLDENHRKIQTSLHIINFFLTKISHLHKDLEKIKFPEKVNQTIKKVQQTTKELHILNAQILEKNKINSNEQLQVLQDALTAFEMEAEKIAFLKKGRI